MSGRPDSNPSKRPAGGAADAPRDPFADDVLERLRRSNQDYQRTHGHYIVPLSERLLALRARVRELESALAQAVEFAEEGWGYASDYFKQKWRYEEELTQLRAVLAAGGRSPEGICEECGKQNDDSGTSPLCKHCRGVDAARVGADGEQEE